MTTGETMVVLGGGGFIGHHLVRRLAGAGARVVVLDDWSRGRPALLAEAARAGRVQAVAGDVAAPGVVADLLAETRPRVVYHLAAKHFIPECVARPADTVRVNVLGTQRVVDALAAHPTTRLVFASTADVYAPSEAPHAEDDPLGPGNVYGLSKLTGERVLMQAGRARPAAGRYLAARFFNVYGPGETNPHLLPDLLGAVARGGPIGLGNLAPRRDYVHVADVVDALVRLARYDGPQHVFNVGTGTGTAVREVVALLEAALGRPLEVRVDPAKVRPVERPALVADVRRARRELAWAPRIALAEGLADLVARTLGDAHAPARAVGGR